MNNRHLKNSLILMTILIGISNVEVQSEAIVVENNSDFVDDLTENVMLVAKAETNRIKEEMNKEVEVSKPKIKYVSLDLPSKATGRFKSFMSWKMITSKSSNQFKFQKKCWTDENGMRRYTDDNINFYVGALGSAFGSVIGTKYRVTLDDDGTKRVFYLVLGDCKDDRHTDPTHRFMEANGNVIEFLTSQNRLSKKVKTMGDVSYASEDLMGKIVKLERLEIEK